MNDTERAQTNDLRKRPTSRSCAQRQRQRRRRWWWRLCWFCGSGNGVSHISASISDLVNQSVWVYVDMYECMWRAAEEYAKIQKDFFMYLLLLPLAIRCCWYSYLCAAFVFGFSSFIMSRFAAQFYRATLFWRNKR